MFDPPKRPRPVHRAAALSATLALIVLTGGCSGEDAPPAEKAGALAPSSGGQETLLLDFEELTAGPVTRIAFSAGSGEADVITAGGGALSAVQTDEGGVILRFPTASDSAAGRRAVLNVRGETGAGFAPAERDFQFSVDVMYPPGSAGDTDDDDGDNLLQRGLFGDVGQFKLQVDHLRPACRLAGDEGETLVKATQDLDEGTWYRVVCQRADGVASLHLAELAGAPSSTQAAPQDWRSWTTPDRSGSITESERPAPLSLGGKLNPQGQIVEDAPDQFNGELDNVRIALLP